MRSCNAHSPSLAVRGREASGRVDRTRSDEHVRRPLRLLYVLSLFPCWSETFIVREIAELLDARHDVRILSLKAPCEKLVQPDAARLLTRARHPLAPMQAAAARARAFSAHPRILSRIVARITARLSRRPADAVKSLEALGRGLEHLDWIRQFDPDVIHAHWGTYPSTVAWALGRVLDRPFGMTCHAHDIFANDHLLREKIESAAVPVTISQFNVDYLSRHATPRARDMHVVHCGVELSGIPFRRDGRAEDLLVTVGRLDPIKGFDVLVDAVAELRREGRRVRCRIVGEGPLERELREQIRRRRVEDAVDLVGALPHDEVRAALHGATVFALPSVVTASGDRDGIPVSLMEAMAAGAPVVSTRVSGIPELVDDGREGLLVAERDSSALARAIARLLDDSALRDRIAREARKKVEREFDAAREARKLLALFAHARY